jgi:hypothetical protein
VIGREGNERGSSLRLVLVLVLLVAAVGGATYFLLADDDDDGPAVAPQEGSSTTTTTEPLTGDAEDLLTRLERGRDDPVHVRLESAGGAGEDSAIVEIWRDGDLVRQDVLLDGPSGRSEVSSFQLADGNVICQRPTADGQWVCERAVSVGTETGTPSGLIEAVAANLQGADVAATDDEIDGTAVRCYSIDRTDGATTLCLTDDGVPMRLLAEALELTATTVEREIARDVFTPPAEVPAP